MKKKTIIHLISHNHWDPAWFAQRKYTRKWLVPFIDNLLKTLSLEPGYKYVLDGQTSIIEDYFDQLKGKERGKKRKEMQGYVKGGRLLVGPFYIGSDWTLTSGAAQIHNLLYGHHEAKKLGKVMKVGWLLDQFGFPAQTWQVLKGFGIDSAFLWRGLGMDSDKMKSEVVLASPDSSEILGIYIWDSYRNAMALSETKEIAKERIISEVKKLIPYALTENVLLMNGYEFDPGPDDILPIIDEINRGEKEEKFLQSTPLEYVEAVKRFVERHKVELPEIKGYLYSGRYAPVLCGVWSSRIYLKQANEKCQQALEKWAEPFSVFSWSVGGAYPFEKLSRIWRMLLRNHPHDEICGCGIDDIHRDNIYDYKEVLKAANEVGDISLKIIAQGIKTKSPALVIFNPSAWERSSVVQAVIRLPKGWKQFSLKDHRGRDVPFQLGRKREDKVEIRFWGEHIPPYGYKSYYLTQDQSSNPKIKDPVKSGDNWMRNSFTRVEINEDGSLNITDKLYDKVYRNVGYFEDGADSGDTYNYSFPKVDKIITTLGRKAKITLAESGPLFTRFKIEYLLNLPESLTKNRTKRSKRTRKYPVVSYVELRAGCPRVDFETKVNNVVKDHRLRVLFPTDIKTDHSYAEQQLLDVAKFPIKGETYPKDVPEGMLVAGRDTVPVATRPQRSFVDLTDGERGLAVISFGLPEYEVLLEKNTIALTLLRGVGWLARTDLLTREGDVGWEFFTPDAQCPGKFTYAYSVLPHPGGWQEGLVHYWAEDRNCRIRTVQTDEHGGKLPEEHSFLSLSVEGFNPDVGRMIEVKKTEDDEDLELSFVNYLDREINVKMRVGEGIKKAYRTDLAEEIKEELKLKDGVISLKVKGKEIVALRMKLKPRKLIPNSFTQATFLLPHSFPVEEDLLKVDAPFLVTPEDIKNAKERVREREKILLKKEKDLRYKKGGSPAEIQESKGEAIKVRRYLAEAKYSLLLTQKRWLETNEQVTDYQLQIADIEKEIEGIASQLARLRIEGRCAEFLDDYYKKAKDNAQNKFDYTKKLT